MPDLARTLGEALDRLIGVGWFTLLATLLVAGTVWRHWSRTETGHQVLIARVVLAILAAIGIGLSLRYLALCLQGGLTAAILERLSDLERAGMVFLFAAVSGIGGFVALANALEKSAGRAAPPPIPENVAATPVSDRHA